MEEVLCTLCAEQQGRSGTKLCDRCWELKTRIERDPALALKVLSRSQSAMPHYASNFGDVLAFHQKMGLPTSLIPRMLDQEQFLYRLRFKREELQELEDWFFQQDMVKVVDSLLDLAYVIMGTAVEMGVPWNSCWAHVHAANMKKQRDGGSADMGYAGRYKNRILKPDGWEPPDNEIARELMLAGYNPPESEGGTL